MVSGALVIGSAEGRGRVGLASKPPMGWNPYYQYGCRLDERIVHRVADAMVSSGMRARGYRYVNLDDCWMDFERDAKGELRSDPTRFPSGVKALGRYVHARGLRLGIYLDAGSRTCAQRPGSAGHLGQDARTLARWGVDFVKVDWCNTGNLAARPIYARLRAAIARTGRPMVFSICEWGLAQPWRWGAKIGAQMWRTAGDLTWYGAPPDWWGAVQKQAEATQRLASFARPGAWNENDVLLAGVNTLNEPGSVVPTGDPATGRLSDEQARAQFSIWSMQSSPLLADNDVTSMSTPTRRTLLNQEVIAVDQDTLAAPSRVVARYGAAVRLSIRRLSNGDWALLAFNPDTRSFATTVAFRRIRLGTGRYAARDLWAHRSRPPSTRLAVVVPATGAAMFRLRRATPRRHG
jgi:alpha-galactosidase